MKNAEKLFESDLTESLTSLQWTETRFVSDNKGTLVLLSAFHHK
jgi:hypothetical protein